MKRKNLIFSLYASQLSEELHVTPLMSVVNDHSSLKARPSLMIKLRILHRKWRSCFAYTDGGAPWDCDSLAKLHCKAFVRRSPRKATAPICRPATCCKTPVALHLSTRRARSKFLRITRDHAISPAIAPNWRDAAQDGDYNSVLSRQQQMAVVSPERLQRPAF